MFVHLIFHSALNFALRLYSFRCQVGLRILCEHDDLTYDYNPKKLFVGRDWKHSILSCW